MRIKALQRTGAGGARSGSGSLLAITFGARRRPAAGWQLGAHPLVSRENMKDIAFRRARPDEAQQLTELALASKRYWGYSETLIELWRRDLAFTPESIRAHTVIVAEQAGRLVGVSAVSQSGDTAELEDLWVHPSRVGQGLGRALFRKAVGEARAQGAASLVIASDPHAEQFYIRLGATPAGRVPSKPAGRRLPRLIFHIGGRAAGARPGRTAGWQLSAGPLGNART